MRDYKQSFYDSLDETSLPSARHVVPMVLDLVPAKTVIDLGCGNGSWLRAFRENKVERVHGVDGPWIEESQLHIPAECFQRAALAEGVQVDDKFDLSMSLEVAEHFHEERAASFVADLCSLAPVVLFSAAIPEQGGVNHFNEQWPGYWQELFARQGFECVDVLRMRLWNAPEVTWWYKQNILLFATPQALQDNPKLGEAYKHCATSGAPVPSLVHPEMFEDALKRTRPPLKRWLKMAPAAFRRSFDSSDS